MRIARHKSDDTMHDDSFGMLDEVISAPMVLTKPPEKRAPRHQLALGAGFYEAAGRCFDSARSKLLCFFPSL